MIICRLPIQKEISKKSRTFQKIYVQIALSIEFFISKLVVVLGEGCYGYQLTKAFKR